MAVGLLADWGLGLWQEWPDGGTKDGLKPAPVPTTILQPTVSFRVHEFVNWASGFI